MKRLALILLGLVLLSSCNIFNGPREENISDEVTIHGLGEDHWTYFCFETGQVVGTSKYLDATEDALWADRLDWDFAICGNYLKTNSGTSGKGKGGALIDKDNAFAQVKEAPTSGYLEDVQMIAK